MRHKGFSLVEAAIVLGIVGLVIGGIWVVATSVRQKQISNHVAESVVLGVTNVRNSYNNMLGLPSGATVGTDVTPMAVFNNALPGDFNYQNGKFRIPGGGTIFMQVNNYSGLWRLDVLLEAIARQTCIEVATRVLSTDPGFLTLYQITYTTNGVATASIMQGTTFEQNLATTTANCQTSTTLGLNYRLN